MEKLLIVSQTCPKCFSLLNSISQNNLVPKLMNNNVTIVYYNDYLKNSDLFMKKAVEYMENLDSDRYKGIPYVTPVLLDNSDNPENSSVLAVGEMGIFNYLTNMQ